MPGGPGQGPGGIGGGTGTAGGPAGPGTAGGPNVNKSTALPIFDEDNLPSAKEHGVLIAVRLENGELGLGLANGSEWKIFP